MSRSFQCLLLLVLLGPGSVKSSPYWSSKDTSVGPAEGGDLIRIRGSGFALIPEREIYCRFSLSNFHEQSLADFVDNSTVVCKTPLWLHAAENVSFNLFSQPDFPILYTGIGHDWFLYFENLRGLAQASEGPASGGYNITIHGFGLDAADSGSYECLFYADGSQMSTSVIVLNSSTALCMAPAWGLDHYGKRLPGKPPMDMVSGVNISLMHLNKTVSCGKTPCYLSFFFYSLWKGIDIVDINTELVASLVGGQEITVVGWGFLDKDRYRCEFVDGSESHCSEPVFATSPREIRCLTPSWNHGDFVADVFLRIVNESDPGNCQAGNYFFPAVGAKLQIIAALTNISSVSSPASGGTEILIRGVGFNANSKYTCKFQDITVNASVLSEELLRCTSPHWYQESRSFDLHVFTESGLALLGCSNCWFTYYENVIDITSMSNRSQGPATGGGNLTITGFGFHLSGRQYTCIFSSDLWEESLTSQATVVSHLQMSCSLPSLFGRYSAAITHISLQSTNGSVPILPGPHGESEYVSLCAVDACSFRYLPLWHSLETKQLCATGNEMITISGLGFVKNDSMYVIQSQNSTDLTTEYCNVVNATLLVCKIPALASAYQNLSIQLFEGPEAIDGPSSNQLDIVPCWSSFNVSYGPAIGGVSVAILGAGFKDMSDFYGVMSSTATVNMTIHVVDSFRLYFVTPRWPDVEDDVKVIVKNLLQGVIQYDGPVGLDTFRQQRCWFSVQPSSVPASGGTTLTLTTFAMNLFESLYCDFVINSTRMNSMARRISSELVECEVPQWGAQHTASTVSLSLFDSNNATIPFSLGDGSSSSKSLLIYQVFNGSQTEPKAFHVTGEEIFHVYGYGFKPGDLYICSFVLENVFEVWSETSFAFSTTEIVFKTKFWNHSAGSNALLKVFRSAGGNMGELIADSNPQLIAFHEIVTSIVPTRGSARGNDVITVQGSGFSTDYSYICRFNALSVEAVIVNLNELMCRSPTLLHEEEGIFGFSVLRNDSIKIDRFVYLLNFTSGNNHYEIGADLTFKYFSEWVSFDPFFADRIGYIPVPECPKVYLSGFGFQKGAQYQCLISMGARTAIARAFFVNTTIIEMIAPEWDLVTDSHQYVTNKTNLTLTKSFSPSQGTEWSVVYGGNGSTLPDRTALWIVQINKRPAYDLVHQNTTAIVTSESQDVISIEFATNLRSGVDNNQEQIQTESDQKVTFEILKGYSRMFEVPPNIDTNGILTFKTWPYSFGNTRLCVVLRDDGGTLFGGIDATEPKCWDLIVNPRYLGDYFSFAQSSLEILENSETQVLDRFFIKSPMGLYKDILHNFSAAGDSNFFETEPFVSEFSRLTFKCYPYVFGTTSISVSLSFYNSSDGQMHSHHQDLALNVIAVNSKPSFELNESRIHIEIIENECVTEFCSFPDLVISKYPGPHDLPTTSNMFDWEENDQKVTFQFNNVLNTVFEEPPVMSIDGTLSFKLLPNVFGNISLSLTLKDDGGTENGGIDISDSKEISISIKPRNNQPSFKLNCPQEQWTLNCSKDCTSNISHGCFAKIKISENCIDCEPSDRIIDGCSRHYFIQSFATDIFASAQNLESERNQILSFQFAPSSNELFKDFGTPQLSPEGSLSFCLAQDKHGTAIFQVSLSDSGGTANGGIDSVGPISLTIRVEPVNQPPSFKVAAQTDFGSNVLHLWTSSGQSRLEGFLVDILNGHADWTGRDLEAVQSHTFYVETDLSYFVQAPEIDANGTLTLEVREGMSGVFNMSITMADNGRTDDGTVNPEDPGRNGINVTQTCKVVMSDGYLRLSGAEAPGTYNMSERMGDATSLSAFLGVGREYVRDGGTEYEVMVGSVKGLVATYNLVYGAIEGGGYELPSGRRIENATLRRRNYGQQASLRVEEAGITVVGLEYDARHPLVREGFFFDLVEPENVTMDLEGNSVIQLGIEAVRYKAYPEETSWREGEGDGGLFVEDKNVSRVSTNCHPICRNATL
eukprot:767181-Hanusia_phi.AAC.2